MTDLMQASHQWATRPHDERFATIDDIHLNAHQSYTQSQEHTVPLSMMNATVTNAGEPLLECGALPGMRLTHWAFAQLCGLIAAPANYLRTLEPTTTQLCLNEGMAKRLKEYPENELCLLVRPDQSAVPTLRAITSDRYTRLWDRDITHWLGVRHGEGWRVPPARPAFTDQPGSRPATEADVLEAQQWALAIKVGDMIAPAGLYRGDRDMFAFMVNEKNPLLDPLDDSPLYRGFFVWNSEVGAKSFGLATFMYRQVCGNHIVWDSSGYQEVRLRHTGDVDVYSADAMKAMEGELAEYSEAGTTSTQAMLKAAATKEFATDKDEVIRLVTNLKIGSLSKAVVAAAFESTERLYPVDGNPRTPWGIANGVTRISQEAGYADRRRDLDTAAGKLLETVSGE